MKIRIRYHVWFLRRSWIAGITIYPFIFFKRLRLEVTDKLLRHELEHIYQVRREGWIKFYVTYLWFNIRRGYKNNPYELEANAVENYPLTDAERRLKDRS